MVIMAIMVTLIEGQGEEAAVGTDRISTLRTGRWGAALSMEPCRDHMCCDMAGFPKCQGKSGCAVSTASRANASLPLRKRKGCWSLGSPRAKRLQLPHWFCSGLRLTTAKTFHDLAVLCRVCHSKPAFGWAQRKSQTRCFKRGEKNEKPQLKQLLPSASLTPRVETKQVASPVLLPGSEDSPHTRY